MAVGDIVSGIFTTTAAYQYFQPAASIEIMIFWAGGLTINYSGLNNGVSNAVLKVSNPTEGYSQGSNMRLGINNTNFLSTYGSSSNPCYSGIQIQ
jgi:hypothetical protein